MADTTVVADIIKIAGIFEVVDGCYWNKKDNIIIKIVMYFKSFSNNHSWYYRNSWYDLNRNISCSCWVSWNRMKMKLWKTSYANVNLGIFSRITFRDKHRSLIIRGLGKHNSCFFYMILSSDPPFPQISKNICSYAELETYYISN